jgi:hypothetical protein
VFVWRYSLYVLYVPKMILLLLLLLLLLVNRLENVTEFIYLEVSNALFQSVQSALFSRVNLKTMILPVAMHGNEVSSARGKDIDLVYSEDHSDFQK